MTMTDYKKYDKIVNILRNSKPRLDDTMEVEREIINAITGKQRPAFSPEDFIDFLFGWTRIAWVRRSLVTISVFLLVAFVWQQGIIMRQVRNLSRQAIYISNANIPGADDISEKRLLIYKDLLNIIEENPDLRKFVEKKLYENDHLKIKL
jgi:hypothetical protein